jgi:hypothetical protein
VTRYWWVLARKAEGFPITMACAVAEVSRQAFYDWRLRLAGGPTEAEEAEEALVEVMREIHDEFDETYGSPAYGDRAHQPGPRSQPQAG